MAKKVLPQVYFDEHIKPPVVEKFREEGFTCVMIANTRRYHERDEQDYIGEIYAEGKLFVTSDLEFVDDHVLENNVKHAGIVFIPKDYNGPSDGELHAELAYIAKAFIKENGRNGLRRHIIYLAQDGIRVIDPKRQDHLFTPIIPDE